MPLRPKDDKYPNCKCYGYFGPGWLCGDPECEQVKDCQKSLMKLLKGMVKFHPVPNVYEKTVFKLPDLRGRTNAIKTESKKKS